jgi:flagella basal body P-ring formation protein FlgA
MVGFVNVSSASLSGIEINLREEVRLSGRTFTLSDIAVVKTPNTMLSKRLSGIMLGRIPRAGVTAKLNRADISDRIKRSLPDIAESITWSGSRQTHVQGHYHLYKKQSYIKAAQAHFENWLNDRFSDYHVKPVGQYKDLEIPDGEISVQAEVSQKVSVNKRMCVWIDLFVNNKHYNTLPVWFHVVAKTDVYELSRKLPSKTPIIPDMLQKTVHDITTISGVPVTNLSMIKGKRLSKDLPEGSVLTHTVLQSIPDVEKGEQVKVKASVGKVTLVAKARALEDGNRGDSIRVERLDGSDSYIARVLGSGLAVVEGDNL